ncbi:MAG: trigger factor [Oscillospiraceae bacterium]|nr:trigger factor [Oscillospiraceae bacterium]
MSVKSVEKKEKNQVEIVMEIAADKFEAALNTAYQKRKNSFMLPGWRKGKAPRKMIEKMYGDGIFYEDAVNALFPEAYEEAVTSQDLKVVGRPSLTDMDVSDDKVLTLKVLADLYPEVTLGQYKGLSAVKPAVEVAQEDVDMRIDGIRRRNARMESVERPAAMGDSVIIDFDGYIDGKRFDGGKDENHTLELGSNAFVPGFEDQIVGMKPGEEKDITVTFPEDYVKDLAGKEAVFKIKLHEVKENILPELDDEFAKDVSECDTFEEYKKQIEDEMRKEKEDFAEDRFHDALFEAAIDNMQADVPPSMIEEAVDNIMQEYAYRLGAQGMSLDSYMSMMGANEEQFRASVRPLAGRRVLSELLLTKIAEEENFEITDEDYEAEYAKAAESFGGDVEEVKKFYTKEMIGEVIKSERARELIYSTGIATEPKEEPAEEEKAAEEPKAE